MNIVVCMKQVPDPDGPPSAFEVDSANKTITPKGIPPVISPYDENALEAGLRLKDSVGGKITVLTMGKKISKTLFMKTLAAGADELVSMQDAAFENLDSYSTALALCAAIKKIGGFDLILCGRQAADSNSGQVGIGIAELLGIPCVSFVNKIDVADEKFRLEKLTADGYAVLEANGPIVATISSELYVLRHTSIPEMVKAKKKPTHFWKAADVDVPTERQLNLVSLSPWVSDTQCEFISGSSGEEIGENLAQKLIELGII